MVVWVRHTTILSAVLARVGRVVGFFSDDNTSIEEKNIPRRRRAPAGNRRSVGGKDVILGQEPVNGRKTSKKWVVVLFVVLLLLTAGFGVGLWIINQPQGGGDGDTSQVVVGDVKTTFNEYANYVLKGELSSDDFDYGLISESPYFDKLNGDKLAEYLEVVKQKFEAFSKSYDAKPGTYNIYKLDDYYREFAEVRSFSREEILDKNIEVTNVYVQEYIDAYREFTEVALQIENHRLAEGCAIDGDCYEITEEENNRITGAASEMGDAAMKIYLEASTVFSNVYNEIYGEGSL